MSEHPRLAYEEIEEDKIYEQAAIYVSKKEIIDFATQWDPQPFHISREAGEKSIYGTLTASSVHTLGLSGKIARLRGPLFAVAGSLETKFNCPNPVKADTYIYGKTWAENMRLSKSLPQFGIILLRQTLFGEADELVFDLSSVVLVDRKHYISE